MPIHTDVSKKQRRPEELPFRHQLFIAGRNYTKELQNATISFTSDIGGSGVEFTTKDLNLEEYEDYRMRIHLGYGEDDLDEPYFIGRVANPKDSDTSNLSTAQGFGPFKVMMDQDIETGQSFQGQTLEKVIMDLAYHSEHDYGDIEVIGGRRYTIPHGEFFAFDQTAGDVISTLIEQAEFVAADQPGGKRVVMPRPRPGVNTGYSSGLYTPDNYLSFSLNPKHETSYYSVIVYRMGEAGEEKPVVFAEKFIQNKSGKSPPRWRRFKVSDFPGDNNEAADVAAELALDLSAKERSFTMTCFFNRNLLMYSGFRAVRVRKLPDGRRERRVYSCTIDSGITVTVAPGSMGIMEVSGSCYELTALYEIIDDRTEPPAMDTRHVVYRT